MLHGEYVLGGQRQMVLLTCIVLWALGPTRLLV